MTLQGESQSWAITNLVVQYLHSGKSQASLTFKIVAIQKTKQTTRDFIIGNFTDNERVSL